MRRKRRKGKSIVRSKAKKNYAFGGIQYKSSLEKTMAVLLTEAGIPFQYEPKTFDIVKGFNFDIDSYERQTNGKGDMINRGRKKVQPIKYTPDFIGDGFIIETKGYANDTFPLRWKLFKRMLHDEGMESIVLYKPQKISECEEVIKLIKERYEQERSGK